MLPLGFRT
jgi:hypothetical protein